MNQHQKKNIESNNNDDIVDEINPDVNNENLDKTREKHTKESEEQNQRNRGGVCAGCLIF